MVALLSCTPTEKLKYTINTAESKDSYYNNRSEKTIQPYDYLYIKIYSLDEQTNAIFESEDRYGQQNIQLLSYEVNERGYIDFPFIGDIMLADLTIDEAKDKLEKELNKYLTNISVRVRFVGNKVTVLGEVRHPGNHTFFDEKITIFQALGLAGDIADFGDKTNITLVREVNNQVSYSYLNLTEKNIAASDYYYLIPNDILIVNPVKAKYRSMQDRSAFVLVISVVTSAATIWLGILNYNLNAGK